MYSFNTDIREYETNQKINHPNILIAYIQEKKIS